MHVSVAYGQLQLILLASTGRKSRLRRHSASRSKGKGQNSVMAQWGMLVCMRVGRYISGTLW